MMTGLDFKFSTVVPAGSPVATPIQCGVPVYLIALRARRLLSVVANVEDEDDNEDDEPSIESRQARATHMITAALGPVPFMAVQSLINDPAAILRRLDEKY
jgi:hypothetical protein